MGDTHLNSVEANLEFLHAAYTWFKKEGADFVAQTGDLTEGEDMRPSQKYYLHVQGIDRTVQYVVANYPNTDLTTYFIGGNHDESYMNHSGHDICKHVSLYRRDMIYLGMNEGDIPADVVGTHIKIWHPSKGTAKGLSYQTQGLLDYFVNKNEKKPNILIIGHYHKFDALFDHNVHAYQAGTTQNQSGWMRTKNLAADLMCWLLDVYYKPSGEVDRIDERYISWKEKGGIKISAVKKS